jgi:hypothetical protein
VLVFFNRCGGQLGIVNHMENCAALPTRSDLCIPRNETAQPRSQFPLSFIPRSVHLFCCSKIGEPIVEIYKIRSEIHEYRKWERDHAVSFLKIFVLNFRNSVLAVWNPNLSCGSVKKIRSNFVQNINVCYK